jgi:hypothetical protein
MTKLDESTLITSDLLRRFELVAKEGNGTTAYYALIRRSNGEILTHHPFGMSADPAQLLWGAEVLAALNTCLDHDGAWVVVFTNPKPGLSIGSADFKHRQYSRYCLMWMDQDGDVQFDQEWVEGEGERDLMTFPQVIAAGIHSTMEKCEASWQFWANNQRVLELTEGQTFKRARGQSPKRVNGS